jgi:hypothetical protein
MADKEIIGRFNLVTGEDTYSGQNAQNPATSRRVLSLIPSINGELVREKGEALYLPTSLGASVGGLFQYDYIDLVGTTQSKRFAATSQSLYMESGGAWVIQSLPDQLFGIFSTVPFGSYPQFAVVNNLLHISDGSGSWIYDGPNNAFVLEGFPIPLDSPTSVDLGAGAMTAAVGIFYWFTYADETTGRVHESSSSGISSSTGAITTRQRTVTPTRGTATSNTANATIAGVGTNFLSSQVGMNLYINGTLIGTIDTVVSSTGITLHSNALSTVAGGSVLIAPKRATHLHIYKSESDGSKLGKFAGKLAVTANPPNYTDNSPFENQPNSTILDINRPIRNDPPVASRVMEPHKYRLWRRRDASGKVNDFASILPNRIVYSANEEVASGTNGSPQESYPGADSNTLSDIINEFLFPKTALKVRALKSHNDALYFGTEKEVLPLWGDTINEFGFSQVSAIDGGVISAWGMESLSHGLAIFSYDRKLYIYPPVSPIYSVTPQDLNVTDQLIEIGRPMRNNFLAIKASDQDNVRILKYRYNSRDWLVVCFQDTNSIYHTHVYDFEIKGWYELQRGFVSLGVFETSPGVKILVGGGTDGKVYVVDDITGSIAPNTTYPIGLFRTSLIDFGKPFMLHEPVSFEIEVSNPDLMDKTTTVNFYLDPSDADSPGDPIALSMSAVQGFPNIYRGYFAAADGAPGVMCRRLMIELNLNSDTITGTFRGLLLKSKAHPLELM